MSDLCSLRFDNNSMRFRKRNLTFYQIIIECCRHRYRWRHRIPVDFNSNAQQLILEHWLMPFVFMRVCVCICLWMLSFACLPIHKYPYKYWDFWSNINIWQSTFNECVVLWRHCRNVMESKIDPSPPWVCGGVRVQLENFN